MLSRHLLRAALPAGLLSLLAGLAAPASAATGRPRTPAGAGFGPAAARQLVRELRAAWQISKGQGVTVAVIYEGVDPSAQGLAGVVTTGPSFGNVTKDNDAGGTVFASAVAGRGPSSSNPAGTLGLAPEARILSIKTPHHAPYGTWQRDLAGAIRYAAGHGAQVIYVAGESFAETAMVDSAVEYAAAKNAVLISAEFPDSRRAPNAITMPASLPGVLGASTVSLPGLPPPAGHIATVANESVLVAAPGNTLTVSGPMGQGYRVFSYLAAGAWLTATVALIKSVYPHLSPSLVDLAIARSARDHPHGGYSTRLGFGLVNPDGALHQAAALAKLKLPVTAATGTGSLSGSARFGSGPPPGVIAAVHHSTSQEAGFAGAMVAGLVLLVIAAALALRWRSRRGRRRKLAGPTGA
jgi:Subtilase family